MKRMLNSMRQRLLENYVSLMVKLKFKTLQKTGTIYKKNYLNFVNAKFEIKERV